MLTVHCDHICTYTELTCRPITSYGALDLPTYFLDLTPFVPLLSDGRPHEITLAVSSGEGNPTIASNWFLTGLVQVMYLIIMNDSKRLTPGYCR